MLNLRQLITKISSFSIFSGVVVASLSNATIAQAQLFVGDSSGTFGTPTPSSAVFTGVGTNTFTWGQGSPPPPSSLNFEGSSFSTELDQLFAVGDLTYFNGTITGGTGADSVPLNILLSTTTPSDINETFIFGFDLISTPNTGTPEENADIVSPINIIPSQSFDVNGVDYTLELLGFSQDGGITIEDDFRVLEGATTTAILFGEITVAPVLPPTPTSTPEPSAMIGLLAVSGLGIANKLKKKSK